jgi:Uncharacterized protein conserved in bacteria (DUF2237)
MLQYGFPGLVPREPLVGTAVNWLQAHHDGAAAYVVLASTHLRALEIVPLEALEEHTVDVPASPGGLEGQRICHAGQRSGPAISCWPERRNSPKWELPSGPGDQFASQTATILV